MKRPKNQVILGYNSLADKFREISPDNAEMAVQRIFDYVYALGFITNKHGRILSNAFATEWKNDKFHQKDFDNLFIWALDKLKGTLEQSFINGSPQIGEFLVNICKDSGYSGKRIREECKRLAAMVQQDYEFLKLNEETMNQVVLGYNSLAEKFGEICPVNEDASASDVYESNSSI